MIQDSNYHRILRVSAVVCAAVLLFESGLISESTVQMSQDTHMYIANSVGATASVAPNEFNVITAELTQQRRLLEAREAALTEREIAIGLSESGQASQRAIYLIASMLFILLTLIILNYALDYLRARDGRKEVVVKTV